MRHAAEHARTRTRERRHRLAVEAARLIAEHGMRDYHQAKLKAAARLGEHDDHALPRNHEVEAALREYQRLFRGDAQPQQLRVRREAALEAMRFLAPFEPRLVGAVLDGTADEHTAVSLHVHADTVEQLLVFLDDRSIPYDQRMRQLRLDRERVDEMPVLLFSADGIAFDLTVLAREHLRQAPLDRSGEQPMQRASLSMLEKLLVEEEIAAFDGGNDMPPMPPMRT